MGSPHEGAGRHAMLTGLKVQEDTPYHAFASGHLVQREEFYVDLQKMDRKRGVFLGKNLNFFYEPFRIFS